MRQSNEPNGPASTDDAGTKTPTELCDELATKVEAFLDALRASDLEIDPHRALLALNLQLAVQNYRADRKLSDRLERADARRDTLADDEATTCNAILERDGREFRCARESGHAGRHAGLSPVDTEDDGDRDSEPTCVHCGHSRKMHGATTGQCRLGLYGRGKTFTLPTDDDEPVLKVCDHCGVKVQAEPSETACPFCKAGTLAKYGEGWAWEAVTKPGREVWRLMEGNTERGWVEHGPSTHYRGFTFHGPCEDDRDNLTEAKQDVERMARAEGEG